MKDKKYYQKITYDFEPDLLESMNNIANELAEINTNIKENTFKIERQMEYIGTKLHQVVEELSMIFEALK